ncbi:glycosyltransferase family 2 protein [Geomesophilobacter sediminis]|uniref:Glycosyltransferase family 2 protein n=1 Tax=Geomesophilobacter sediminis TaxID=2798584 RepID=A0A8J7M2Z3_9BACT|nr:glycosyltransferase family 2 protein [Geomesophilobacter sediminis]MBJ6727569.1 glycosyltransferase family 2 protein [Geomesophilobacter sediminis]
MEDLLFVLFFLAAYPYLIFPFLVQLVGLTAGKGWTQGEMLPKVSMIVSFYNEEAVIADKIHNALKLDYPRELIEIAIVSDGSTDRTNRIADSFEDPRVSRYLFTERKGKTACLNQVIPHLTGEVIVFSDANAMFPPDAIRKLVRNFADPEVGLATGWTKYRKKSGDEETSSLYAGLERSVKYAESLISSCVGADGAIFGIRKGLYQPLKDYDINDFVIPLNVIAQRKRVVLDPELFCLEPPASDGGKEFRRQTRITNRTLGAIARNRTMLNPLRYRSFAFFLWSHKVLRFLAPFWSLGVFATALYLAFTSLFYAFFAAVLAFFVGMGIAGLLTMRGGRLTRLCSFLLLTFWAQAIGWGRWIQRKNDVLWKPER